MNRFKISFILLFIVILAAVLRLWQLGSVPISPDWDEVALGYNAYSIMLTGKDEYGKFMPIILRSYDDYKPALYAYLVIPFIKFFGLKVFAVRLSSAIMGILTVIATYFLVKELFPKTKSFLVGKFSFSLPHIASFLLAISPWHLQFSRVAFESNVGLSFNIFALLFFLKGLKKYWFLLLSAFCMGINFYVYQSEKVFVPLFFLAVVLIFRSQLFTVPRKYIVIAVMIGLITSLPIVIITVTNSNNLSRAQGTSFLSEKTPLLEKDVKKLVRDREQSNVLGLVFNNRRVVYAKTIISGYVSHFDLNWLFIKGDYDTKRHHAPNMGLLYFWELPFLLIGIYMVVFGNFDKKTKALLFSWFLIAPIPASVTTGVPHPVRTLNFLPTFQIFTAVGVLTSVGSISNIKYQISKIQIRYLLFVLCFLFFIFNFSYYLNQYFVQQNYYYSKDWQYGYKELADYLRPIHNKYNKIIVSNSFELSQSYMFFLFYFQYNPQAYIASGGTASGGFAATNKFLNFEFRSFDYYKEKEKNMLLVGGPSDFPEEFKVIHTILYKDNSLAIKVVERNK